jgi:hypothetical protein
VSRYFSDSPTPRFIVRFPCYAHNFLVPHNFQDNYSLQQVWHVTLTASLILSDLLCIGYHFDAYFSNLCTFKDVRVEKFTNKQEVLMGIHRRIKNDASNNSIVVCVFVAAATFLPSRCRAMMWWCTYRETDGRDLWSTPLREIDSAIQKLIWEIHRKTKSVKFA